MLRISIKTKLGFTLGLLVLSFFAFNVVYYPRRVESQIRNQAEISARQVAETASYALTPALNNGNREDIAKVLEGVNHIPAFSFSVVYDSTGKRLDSTQNTPSWVDEYTKSKAISQVITRPQDGVMVAKKNYNNKHHVSRLGCCPGAVAFFRWSSSHALHRTLTAPTFGCGMRCDRWTRAATSRRSLIGSTFTGF